MEEEEEDGRGPLENYAKMNPTQIAANPLYVPLRGGSVCSQVAVQMETMKTTNVLEIKALSVVSLSLFKSLSAKSKKGSVY